MNDKLITALESLDESLTHMESAIDKLLTRQSETSQALTRQMTEECGRHTGLVQGLAHRLDQAIARLEAALEEGAMADDALDEDREAS